MQRIVRCGDVAGYETGTELEESAWIVGVSIRWKGFFYFEARLLV
jgi:hypothetical protein